MIVVLFRHWTQGGIPAVSKISAQVSGWPYTHCGVWIAGDRHVYEATMRRDVTRRPLSEWKPQRRGEILAVTIEGCNELTLRTFLEAQQGKRYDWKSVLLDKVYRLTKTHNPNAWFCSEYVAEALARAGCLRLDRPSSEIMPVTLYALLTMQQQPTTHYSL